MQLRKLKFRSSTLINYLFILLSINAINAYAITRYVDKNNPNCASPEDTLYCELQDAVNDAVNGDILYVATGTYSNTQIPISGQAPNPDRTLTIKGAGINKTIIKGGFQRALNIRESVTISDLTIRDSQPTKAGPGGGVYIPIESSVSPAFIVDVLFDNVSIENNWAGVGGGIATRLAGNTNNALTVTLRNSVVLNNTSRTNHPEPSHRFPSPGGGVYVDTGVTFNIINSAIAFNSAIPGTSVKVPGGGYAGGIFNIGTTNIINSTIYSNESQAAEGGGGAIRNGVDANAGVLNLYNVTISNNSAINAYGAIHNDFGSISISNSIIAGNTDNNIAPNCGGAGQFVSSGYNLVGDLTGCVTLFPANVVGDRLQTDFNLIALDPLPFVGDPGYGIAMFMVQPIRAGSMAIDAGNDQSGCTVPTGILTNDQRGIPRPYDGDNNGSLVCDAGAYENAPGLLVYPEQALLTFENQGTASLSLALSTVPSQPVIVDISSDKTSEGSIQANSNTLSFNSTNWNTLQQAFIDVINDGTEDGDQSYMITLSISGDPQFSSASDKTIVVTNVDVGLAPQTLSPGLEVSPSINIAEGGRIDALSVRLTKNPAENKSVRLNIMSEQADQDQISESNPIFTEFNWNSFQNINISAVDDNILETELRYNIVISVDTTWSNKDGSFDGIQPINVNVVNQDNDFPAITIQYADPLITYEDPAQPGAVFTVVLESAPLADSTLNFVSNAENDEGMINNINTPMPLTFTTANWNVPQSVEIIGVDDDFYDGDITYTITADAPESGGRFFTNITLPEIPVINTDDEIAGILLSGNNLITSEDKTNTTFDVTLTSPPEPGKTVTLLVISEDKSEGEVNPASLLFNYNNYDTPQTVTVTGVNDATVDTDQTYNINISTDPNASGDTQSTPYRLANVLQTVSVTNLDNDLVTALPQVIISADQLTTSEAGGEQASDAFSIRLNTQPADNVTIEMKLDDSSEGSFNNSNTSDSVSFSQTDWDIDKSVTIFAVDDPITDGPQTYKLSFSVTSSDLEYHNMVLNPITVENLDNDSDTVTPNSGLDISKTSLNTSENGSTDSFGVSLLSAPDTELTLTFLITNPSEGQFTSPENDNPSVAYLTFTPTNWNIVQNVVVRGIDDPDDDGNRTYQITIDGYNNVIQVTNDDNDKPVNTAEAGSISLVYVFILLVYMFNFSTRSVILHR